MDVNRLNVSVRRFWCAKYSAYICIIIISICYSFSSLQRRHCRWCPRYTRCLWHLTAFLRIFIYSKSLIKTSWAICLRDLVDKKTILILYPPRSLPQAIWRSHYPSYAVASIHNNNNHHKYSPKLYAGIFYHLFVGLFS